MSPNRNPSSELLDQFGHRVEDHLVPIGALDVCEHPAQGHVDFEPGNLGNRLSTILQHGDKDRLSIRRDLQRPEILPDVLLVPVEVEEHPKDVGAKG